jgi:hypothetical protein
VGELLGQQATPGEAEHVDERALETLKDADQNAAQPAHRERLQPARRAADPRGIDAHQLEVRKVFRKWLPGVNPAAQAVKEKEGLAGADHADSDGRAVRVNQPVYG